MGSRVRMTMVGVAMIGVATGTVWAQTPSPRPSPGVERPAGERAPTTTGMVEGTVSKIDPTTGKMRVSSGLFGWFGKRRQGESLLRDAGRAAHRHRDPDDGQRAGLEPALQLVRS
jgi:hypothetical protein